MLKTFRFVIALALCFGLTACAHKGSDAKLATRLDPLLQSFDDSGAIYAARVLELPSGRELYSYRAGEPMIPASNGKLANGAAALDHFGPDYRFKTYLAIDGDNLWLIGSGDPGCGDDKIAAKYGGRGATQPDA